jgi:hypothetical protein
MLLERHRISTWNERELNNSSPCVEVTYFAECWSCSIYLLQQQTKVISYGSVNSIAKHLLYYVTITRASMSSADESNNYPLYLSWSQLKKKV